MDDMAKFSKSQTCENLMRSFAGESQARNRYTMAAALARQNSQECLARIFQFTADQEKAHAKLFYDALGELKGKTVTVDGTYPVDVYSDILSHLKAAQHNEHQEWQHDYATFARIAEEEDYPILSKLFATVADVERVHGNRFGRYVKRMEESTLYADPQPQEWMCLHCGLVVKSTVAPAHCPLCHHPQGYYIRRDENPYY